MAAVNASCRGQYPVIHTSFLFIYFFFFFSIHSLLLFLNFPSLAFFLFFFLLGSWNVAESYQISSLLQILIVNLLKAANSPVGSTNSVEGCWFVLALKQKPASIQPAKWAKRYVHSKRKLLGLFFFNKYAARMARLLLRHLMTSAWLLLRNHVTLIFLFLFFVRLFCLIFHRRKRRNQRIWTTWSKSWKLTITKSQLLNSTGDTTLIRTP